MENEGINAQKRIQELRDLIDDSSLNGDISTKAMIRLILDAQMHVAESVSVIQRQVCKAREDVEEVKGLVQKIQDHVTRNPSLVTLIKQRPKLFLSGTLVIASLLVPQVNQYAAGALKLLIAALIG